MARPAAHLDQPAIDRCRLGIEGAIELEGGRGATAIAGTPRDTGWLMRQSPPLVDDSPPSSDECDSYGIARRVTARAMHGHRQSSTRRSIAGEETDGPPQTLRRKGHHGGNRNYTSVTPQLCQREPRLPLTRCLRGELRSRVSRWHPDRCAPRLRRGGSCAPGSGRRSVAIAAVALRRALPPAPPPG